MLVGHKLMLSAHTNRIDVKKEDGIIFDKICSLVKQSFKSWAVQNLSMWNGDWREGGGGGGGEIIL